MEKPRMFTFAGRVIKNLFQKPATTQYPFEPVEYPERMRGHIRIEIENCITCGLCMRSCPSQAIRVDRKAGTWTIERFDCVQCGFCVATCPKKCLFMEKGYTEPDILKKSETFTRPKEENLPDPKKRRRRIRLRREASLQWIRKSAYTVRSARRNVRRKRFM